MHRAAAAQRRAVVLACGRTVARVAHHQRGSFAAIATSSSSSSSVSVAAALTGPQQHRRSFASRPGAVGGDGTLEIKLTDIGEGIAEVEIIKWHVAVGDEVNEFDVLCEVQSDKATVEITSRYHGKVKALSYSEKQMAKTGSTLLQIELLGDSKDEAASATAAKGAAASAAAAANEPSVSGGQAPTIRGGRVLATPAVRHIARSNSIDLSTVPATGKAGRVLKEDIIAFLDGGSKVTKAAATPAPTVAPAKAAPVNVSVATPADQEFPLTGYGKVMVQTMNAANQVCHFGYDDEIVMDRLLELRARMKPIAEERGVKVSPLAILIKAASLALKEFPMLNAHFDPTREVVIRRGAHNVSIAVDSPAGLIVPNIKNCEQKSIFEIAAEINRLQVDCARGKVSPADLKDGTFSLSNIGAIGGTYAVPVLVVPQVLIGALGKTQRLPRFKNDHSMEVVARQIMKVSWAGDHRVLDGATVARFSNRWKQYVEDPDSLLMELR